MLKLTKQCLTSLDHSNPSQTVMGMCAVVALLTNLTVLLWYRVTRSTQDYCFKNFTLTATTVALTENMDRREQATTFIVQEILM